MIMKIAFIYPEYLPSKKAHTISIVKTSSALSEYTGVNLIINRMRASVPDICSYYDIKPKNLTIREIGTIIPLFNFEIKSNKLFYRNFIKISKKTCYDIVYIRRLKQAQKLIENKSLTSKIIYECHVIEHLLNENQHKQDEVRAIEQYVYANVDGLVFINETLQKKFKDTFLNLTENQQVAYLGSSIFSKENIDKDFQNIKEIFYIGNFMPWKGVDVLVKAMQYLPNLKLNLIGGKDSQDIAFLKELVHKLNISDRVCFWGYKDPAEIRDILLYQAKLVVIPNNRSDYENFTSPIKLFEAMTSYNIVVASGIPTINEITKNGEAAYLAPPGDAKSLAKEILYAVDHPTKAKEKAENALLIGKQYTWKNRAKMLYHFFEDILNG